MTREEESALIRRILDGETQAFEQLVAEHQKIVYNLALRILGNPEDALDMSQEAFFKAYRSLSGFRGDASFSSWLYRLTTNVCLDHLRKAARRNECSLTLDDGDGDGDAPEHAVPDTRPSPEAALETKERRLAVRRALEKLPPDFREPLLLREIGGLSYEEVARQTGLEAGTVKSRIFRARKKLASILLQDGNFSEAGSSDGKEVR